MYYFKLILIKAYKEGKKLEQYCQADVAQGGNNIKRATMTATLEPQNPGEKIFWRNEYWDKLIRENIIFSSNKFFVVSAGEGEECEIFKQFPCLEQLDDEEEDQVDLDNHGDGEMLTPEDNEIMILNPQDKESKREVFKVLEGGKFKEE